ncbi:MAG: hypothetical protein K0S04_1677 [Herbinix sp.]|jgi:hypothetical protein|nr:hypothetical protein [Herbinix sp.]
MLKKNDLILVGIILLLCIGFFTYRKMTEAPGSKVEITVNGELYDTLMLQEDTVYTVKIDHDAYNTFQITNGVVDMIDASCPDKLCVNQSGIHHNHETIVCLPNKVILEVVNAEDSDVDIIAN